MIITFNIERGRDDCQDVCVCVRVTACLYVYMRVYMTRRICRFRSSYPIDTNSEPRPHNTQDFA